MSEPAKTAWTQAEFFAWERHHEGRYEFDGFAPVAMTGGSLAHSRIMRRLFRALEAAVGSGPCEPLGPEIGVVTAGNAVRCPDAVIRCGEITVEPQSYTLPDVVVVFEIISPSSSRVDRIIKVREYAAVSTIRRYVIIESAFPGLQVLARANGDEAWSTTTLTSGDILRMPEMGADISVDALYEGVFPAGEAGAALQDG